MQLTSLVFSWVILTCTWASSRELCEVARLKCAYRTGCGMALHNYMFECADVMSGRSARCSDVCTKSLIALSSTDEGQDLIRCDCRDNEFCAEAKRRVEVCRPAVVDAMKNTSIVSCSVAHWICAADALCSTALTYYHRLCRSMIRGKKCTQRCNNSIAILNRQEKASKLRNCICDGSEDYDCEIMKYNMDHLCFKKKMSSGTQEDVRSVRDRHSAALRTGMEMNAYLVVLMVIFVLR